MKILLFIFLFAIGSSQLLAQKLIVENIETGLKIEIFKGRQIAYKGNGDLKKGRFKGCFDSFVYTKNDTFNINHLSVFGTKNINRMLLEIGARITYYSSIALFGLGVGLYAAFRQAPEVGTFIMIFAKVPMEIAKYYIQQDKYLMYNLEGDWQLKIVSR